MNWNERTTDCVAYLRKCPRPTCREMQDFDPALAFEPMVPRALLRDILFGPKVLAELAILRRLAA